MSLCCNIVVVVCFHHNGRGARHVLTESATYPFSVRAGEGRSFHGGLLLTKIRSVMDQHGLQGTAGGGATLSCPLMHIQSCVR